MRWEAQWSSAFAILGISCFRWQVKTSLNSKSNQLYLVIHEQWLGEKNRFVIKRVPMKRKEIYMALISLPNVKLIITQNNPEQNKVFWFLYCCCCCRCCCLFHSSLLAISTVALFFTTSFACLENYSASMWLWLQNKQQRNVSRDWLFFALKALDPTLVVGSIICTAQGHDNTYFFSTTRKIDVQILDKRHWYL